MIVVLDNDELDAYPIRTFRPDDAHVNCRAARRLWWFYYVPNIDTITYHLGGFGGVSPYEFLDRSVIYLVVHMRACGQLRIGYSTPCTHISEKGALYRDPCTFRKRYNCVEKHQYTNYAPESVSVAP